MARYIAITIGPIFETISMAQKTSDLWASSYMFSYIMKELTNSVSDLGDILLPLPSDGYKNKPIEHFGAGLYPDRIYMRCSNDDVFLEINNKIEEVIDKFSKDVYSDMKKSRDFSNKEIFSEEKVIKFFKSFFKIYSCCIEINDKDNIVEVLSEYCDSFECHNRIESEESKFNLKPTEKESSMNPLQWFLHNIKDSFLFKEAFPKDQRFKSLIEICTSNICGKKGYSDIIKKHIGKENDEDLILNELKEKYGDTICQYHKYFAIVYADGDNIGKIVKDVGRDPDELKEFSKKLFGFSLEASKKIRNKGAVPIYMGGDDMMFLSPILMKNSESNIFNLISELDLLFKEKIVDKYPKQVSTDLKDKPSMSYGICISYFKTPIYETRKEAYKCLENIKNPNKEEREEKNEKDKDSKQKSKNLGVKNKVSVKYLKRSYKDMSFILDKSSNNQLEVFLEFLKENIGQSSHFMNGFTYKLSVNKNIIKNIAGDRARLDAFLEHNFNENYTSNKKFFDALSKYINEIYISNDELSEEDFDLIYSSLMLTDFINGKEIS
ncbi:MAG: hypothetical protein N4A32_03410 [Marinifilaceae bacterium]|jgi:CRISPR-associated protein Cmr2|nr:hypothetical protein [Marinifilaceae bacterium]